jgi:hypothetical protein
MRTLAICLVLAAVASAGCLRATEFRCQRDADCGASGRCEPIGFCSLPNAACADTGRSFSDSAGQSLSSTCVPATDRPGPDAGVDPGPDTGVDAPPPAGCAADYASIAGSAHLYKRLSGVSWDQAGAACRASSASAYLAVPDDASELVNLAAAAVTVPFWIGLDDQAQPGMFTTQNGAAATFLPWAPGQPDSGKPGRPQDCVIAVSATEIATDRCGTPHTAVCECEP